MEYLHKNGLHQHGYKIRDELKPHCKECNQKVTDEHLIWKCAVYITLKEGERV
jgi:hypothetical protein